MSDLKNCPYCQETIKAKAVFCRYCRHDLTAPLPDWIKRQQREQAQKQIGNITPPTGYHSANNQPVSNASIPWFKKKTNIAWLIGGGIALLIIVGMLSTCTIHDRFYYPRTYSSPAASAPAASAPAAPAPEASAAASAAQAAGSAVYASSPSSNWIHVNTRNGYYGNVNHAYVLPSSLSSDNSIKVKEVIENGPRDGHYAQYTMQVDCSDHTVRVISNIEWFNSSGYFLEERTPSKSGWHPATGQKDPAIWNYVCR